MLIKRFRETYIVQTGDFGEMCNALLQQIPTDRMPTRMVFFGCPLDNKAYIEELKILNDQVCSVFKEFAPPLTYVAQKPLGGGLALEVCLFEKIHRQRICYRQFSGIRYCVIQSASGKELMIGGAMPDDSSTSVYPDAASVFEKINSILIREGIPVNAIVRQWNYIENITELVDGKQNYQEFNRARSLFYANVTWENGYPAATGIGTKAGGVIIQLEAFLGSSPDINNSPINSALQVPAHSYSNQVLIGSSDAYGTPKFERARLIGVSGTDCVYVSGTAAIRGERSIASGDPVEQTRLTIENIFNLVSGESLKAAGYAGGNHPEFEIFIIYLKNEPDLKPVRAFMNRNHPSIDPLYLLADLCRDELLVEIEAMIILT